MRLAIAIKIALRALADVSAQIEYDNDPQQAKKDERELQAAIRVLRKFYRLIEPK